GLTGVLGAERIFPRQRIGVFGGDGDRQRFAQRQFRRDGGGSEQVFLVVFTARLVFGEVKVPPPLGLVEHVAAIGQNAVGLRWRAAALRVRLNHHRVT